MQYVIYYCQFFHKQETWYPIAGLVELEDSCMYTVVVVKLLSECHAQ